MVGYNELYVFATLHYFHTCHIYSHTVYYAAESRHDAIIIDVGSNEENNMGIKLTWTNTLIDTRVAAANYSAVNYSYQQPTE